MINRQNWLDIRAYLHHMDHRVGRHPATLHKYRTQLRHLLEWADATPFPQARNVDPAFPTYLITARNDGKASRLSYTTIYKTLITVRAYFQFARLEFPNRYRKISESWIELLRPSRLSKPSPQLQDHRFYTLDNVRRILDVSVETLHDRRAQVALAMLFLSGMRPDTLASLPINCVDLDHRRILQLPDRGVRTKNNKAAITYLLDIPELFEVIHAWQAQLDAAGVPSDCLWYATLNNDGTRLTATTRAIVGRVSVIGDDIRMICQKAGVEYLSPHKLRHGHIVHARNLARDMAQLKAISQNVMHASVVITDQVYAALTEDEVGNIISSLGTQPSPKGELISQLTVLLEQLKNDNGQDIISSL